MAEVPKTSFDPISLKTFLETVSPYCWRQIHPAKLYDAPGHGLVFMDVLPEVRLFCGDSRCNDMRYFLPPHNDQELRFYQDDTLTYRLVQFRCKNCGGYLKFFALVCRFDENTPLIAKFGELPRFGFRTPPRVRVLLGESYSLFEKGRQLELDGYGVGSFAYYRQIVEAEKNRILDNLIKACNHTREGGLVVPELEAAKREMRFSASMSHIKTAFPDALNLHGHNPLSILHSALSDGLHARTDEECLVAANHVRVVLVGMAEAIGHIMKEDGDLKKAVTFLAAKPKLVDGDTPSE